MDLWEILGLLGVLALWASFGVVSWLAAVVLTGGRRVAWTALPLALLVAVAGAAFAPAVGLKGWAGFWTAAVSALLLSTAAMLLAIGLTSPREPAG
jgi:hypothetical protein